MGIWWWRQKFDKSLVFFLGCFLKTLFWCYIWTPDVMQKKCSGRPARIQFIRISYLKMQISLCFFNNRWQHSRWKMMQKSYDAHFSFSFCQLRNKMEKVGVKISHKLKPPLFKTIFDKFAFPSPSALLMAVCVTHADNFGSL